MTIGFSTWPGKTENKGFQTDINGTATDADVLPTASLRRNGVVDGGVTVTVSNLGTGDYNANWTTPVGYAVDDDIEVVAEAVLSGDTTKLSIFRGTIVNSAVGVSNEQSFFDNGGSASGKTQDDVGSSVTVGPVGFFSQSGIVNNGTETGTHTNTHTAGDPSWQGDRTGAGFTMQLEYDIDTAEPDSIDMVVRVNSGGNRNCLFEVENKQGGGWDVIGLVGNTGGADTQLTVLITSDNVGAGGEVTIRAVDGSNSLNNSDSVEIVYARVIAIADTGTVPSAQEIAIAVDQLQSTNHGPGNWEGDIIEETVLASPASAGATSVTLATGPQTNDLLNNNIIIVLETSDDPPEGEVRLVTDWDGTTLTASFNRPLQLNYAAGDPVSLRIHVPTINAGAVDGAGTAAFNTPESVANRHTFFDNNSTVSSLELDDVAQQAASTEILSRLGVFDHGSNANNTLLGFLLAALRSDAPLPPQIGGTYAVATDSQQGISLNGTNQNKDITDRIGAFDYGTDANNTILGFMLAGLRKDAPLPPQIGGTYMVDTHSQEGAHETSAANDLVITQQIVEVQDRIGAFDYGTDPNNTVLGYFAATLRKDAPLPPQIGGTYAVAQHSQEAIGDGGGGTDYGPILSVIQDRVGYILTGNSGAIANPQTSGELFQLDLVDDDSVTRTYSVQSVGLTSTGGRGTPVLSKT